MASQIGEYSVFAEHKHAHIGDVGRLDFVNHYIGRWYDARRFRAYAAMAAIVGAYFLFSLPIVSVAAFAIAAYAYTLHQMNHWYTEGDYAGHRSVVTVD